MRRRDFLLGGLIAAAHPARAQGAKLPRLAILSPTFKTGGHSGIVYAPLMEALGRLGWVDGTNLEIVERFADDRYERLPALAAELVATQPDVIFTNTVNGALAAAEATRTIPVVVAPAGENVFVALAENFARPVRNVTGFTLHAQGHDEKCLEMMKEAVPLAARVGILVNPLNPAWDRYPASLRSVGEALGLELVRMEARGADEIRAAFAAVESAGIHGVLVPDDSILAGRASSRRRILEMASLLRVPVASTHVPFAPEGALFSLGADIPALARRGAEYVDRILKGAKPKDLPVERPSIVRLVLNLKAARDLGLSVPPSILLRADEVIE